MKEQHLNTKVKKIAIILSSLALAASLLLTFLHFNYVTYREATTTVRDIRSLEVVVKSRKPSIIISGGKLGKYTLESSGSITIVPTGIHKYQLHMNILQKYDPNYPAFGPSQGEALVVDITRPLPAGIYDLEIDYKVIGLQAKYNTALMDGVDLSQQYFTERFVIR